MATPLYEKGMALRRKILGDKHIAQREASGAAYTQRQYEMSTEIAYGMLWSRPGLPLKVRSLVTLGMLTALDRPDELRGHIRGALNNGATQEEIGQALARSGVRSGRP